MPSSPGAGGPTREPTDAVTFVIARACFARDMAGMDGSAADRRHWETVAESLDIVADQLNALRASPEGAPPFTLEELAEFARGFDAADELVAQLNNEGRAWTLRTSALADDPDLIFADAVAAGRRLLAFTNSIFPRATPPGGPPPGEPSQGIGAKWDRSKISEADLAQLDALPDDKPGPAEPSEEAITAARVATEWEHGVVSHWRMGAALRAAYAVDFGRAAAGDTPHKEG